MEWVEIGEVTKPQGIKGELKLRHFCDSAAMFYDFKVVYLKDKDGYQPLTVEKVRTDRESVFLKLGGIETRDEVEGLRGELLYADKADFPSLPEDNFYVRDLIGLLVETTSGKPLGKITEVLQHGAVDVYCVKSETKSLMFPALKRVMVKTDIAKGKMVLDEKALLEVAVYED